MHTKISQRSSYISLITCNICSTFYFLQPLPIDRFILYDLDNYPGTQFFIEMNILYKILSRGICISSKAISFVFKYLSTISFVLGKQSIVLQQQGRILGGSAGRCPPPRGWLCTSPEIVSTSPKNFRISPNIINKINFKRQLYKLDKKV